MRAADGGSMRPIIELCAAEVDLRRAPKEALNDFLEHRAVPKEADKPPRRSRGKSRFKSDEYHRWMMQKE